MGEILVMNKNYDLFETLIKLKLLFKIISFFN
ncbi:hypothetical protein MTsPCn9_34870 [Croceitalea sp. MTPC9]|nr:hypothetical protein MTsPCn6_35280 [Croceitalea sp. MTPC6]GMN18547.1 hypothetical protein MTsPCn9_34870 [Croceitalea sp. MTPC9]